MIVILDTNVLVQAIIGSPTAASARALRAYRDRKYQIGFSLETLGELEAVLSMPTIAARHGWSVELFREFYEFLTANWLLASPATKVSASVPRDVTDTKFLALADEVSANFLVTNDRRHLLRLGRHGKTEIVTPAAFLRRL